MRRQLRRDDHGLELSFRSDAGGDFVITIPDVRNIYGSNLTLQSIVFDLTFAYFSNDPNKNGQAFLDASPSDIWEGMKTYLLPLKPEDTSFFVLDSSYGLMLAGVGSWKAEKVTYREITSGPDRAEASSSSTGT